MRYLISLILVFMSMFISAQEQAGIESDSYVYDNVVVLASDLQAVRNVRGGTKIIIEYEGAWPTDIKGAFEYACKIWEEVMPTTYPIHIKAVFDETTVNRGNAYSKFNLWYAIMKQIKM